MSKELVRHIFILILSIFVSFFSIIYCAYTQHWQDGGRGGAIAVALSIFSLFANRPHGDRTFRILTSERDKFFRDLDKFKRTPATLENNDVHVERIIKAMDIRMNIDSTGQSLTNTYMTISAEIGTISWGFGDIISRMLQIYIYGSA